MRALVDALEEVGYGESGLSIGEGSGMVRFDIEPGSLVIFRGLDSLHRVTPVEGTRRRLAAVMCFEQYRKFDDEFDDLRPACGDSAELAHRPMTMKKLDRERGLHFPIFKSA